MDARAINILDKVLAPNRLLHNRQYDYMANAMFQVTCCNTLLKALIQFIKFCLSIWLNNVYPEAYGKEQTFHIDQKARV